MDEIVLLPRSFLKRIASLLDDLGDFIYGSAFRREFIKSQVVADDFLTRLELRCAFDRIVFAINEGDRLAARIHYLQRKLQADMEEARSSQEQACVLRMCLREYEIAIGDISYAEREELRKWTTDGYSPFDNPYLLLDDDGCSMDFITAIRINDDMLRTPDDYCPGYGHKPCLDVEDNALPF